MITYRLVCSLSALVCLILFAIFLISPGAYSAGYGVPSDAGAVFLGNRAAPLFLGLAAMCWLLRTSSAPDVRMAVSLAMILTFVGIAVTGVWAFIDGSAASTILLAAGGEILLAALFAIGLRNPA